MGVLKRALFYTVFIFGLILFEFFAYKILFWPSDQRPYLIERFGTILSHSSDNEGVYEGSYNNPYAVDHNYCYYPKPQANSKLLIKRVDSGDCSDWYGQITVREGDWVSEREKYVWN